MYFENLSAGPGFNERRNGVVYLNIIVRYSFPPLSWTEIFMMEGYLNLLCGWEQQLAAHRKLS